MEVRLGFGTQPAPTPAVAAEAPVRDELETGLVAALVRGEPQALEEIYDRHGRGVYSLALRLVGDPSTAEEVVQETFVKLWRRPAAYQPARGRLLPWLLGVAHHYAVDLLRRRQLERRHQAVGSVPQQGDALDSARDVLPASDEHDPALRLGASERHEVVQGALAELSAAQRVPLELAYYKGLTQSEIATVLDEPLGTVKTRMRLGLQRLRQVSALADQWGER